MSNALARLCAKGKRQKKTWSIALASGVLRFGVYKSGVVERSHARNFREYQTSGQASG